jgi:hypothetical protein
VNQLPPRIATFNFLLFPVRRHSLARAESLSCSCALTAIVCFIIFFPRRVELPKVSAKRKPGNWLRTREKKTKNSKSSAPLLFSPIAVRGMADAGVREPVPTVLSKSGSRASIGGEAACSCSSSWKLKSLRAAVASAKGSKVRVARFLFSVSCLTPDPLCRLRWEAIASFN